MIQGAELIAAYLDDSLNNDEKLALEIWLNADPANLNETVVANARNEQLREAVISGSAMDVATRDQTRRSPTFTRNAMLGAGLAAAVLLVALILLFVKSGSEVGDAVTLRRTTGLVSFHSAGGENSGLLTIGDAIAAGTLETEGEGTRAEFSYADGSTFTLSGGSELTVVSTRSKQLHLRRGAMLGKVSAQQASRPLRIRTASAEAVVRGTSFGLSTADFDTLFQVRSGEAEFRRLSDNRTLRVIPDYRVSTGQNSTESFVAERVSPLPNRWSASQQGSSVTRWLGKWNDDEILLAEPRSVFLKQTGIHENHFHAGAKNPFPGLVQLTEKSFVRVRYRMRRPVNLGLFIVSHTESWDFAGNFQAYVEERKTPADADGWRTAEVSISSFLPMPQVAMPFQPDCVLGAIIATTWTDDVGLEVAELEVMRKKAGQ